MHMPQNVLAETELRHLAAIPYQIISPGSSSPMVYLMTVKTSMAIAYTEGKNTNWLPIPLPSLPKIMNFPFEVSHPFSYMEGSQDLFISQFGPGGGIFKCEDPIEGETEVFLSSIAEVFLRTSSMKELFVVALN